MAAQYQHNHDLKVVAVYWYPGDDAHGRQKQPFQHFTNPTNREHRGFPIFVLLIHMILHIAFSYRGSGGSGGGAGGRTLVDKSDAIFPE